MEPPPSAEAAGAQRRAGWGGNEPSPGGGKRAGPGLCKKLGSGEVGKRGTARERAQGAWMRPHGKPQARRALGGLERKCTRPNPATPYACAREPERRARRRLPAAAAAWGRRPVGNCSPTLSGSPPPVPVLRTHLRTERKRKRRTKLRAPL